MSYKQIPVIPPCNKHSYSDIYMIKDLIAYSSSLAISQLFMLKMQKWADAAENSTLIFKSFKLLLAQFGFLCVADALQALMMALE